MAVDKFICKYILTDKQIEYVGSVLDNCDYDEYEEALGELIGVFGLVEVESDDDFIFLLSELNEIGIIKSIKYIIFKTGTSATYDMVQGYLKITCKEKNRLDKLTTIIDKLNQK